MPRSTAARIVCHISLRKGQISGPSHSSTYSQYDLPERRHHSSISVSVDKGYTSESFSISMVRGPSAGSSASAPPPTLYTRHSLITLPIVSRASNNIPLGWSGSVMCGCHNMLTFAVGLIVSSIARSVRCPRPVAARLPYSVTRYDAASVVRRRNSAAALRGPIVWLLDGPVPIRYNSLILFMRFLLHSSNNFYLTSNLRYLYEKINCRILHVLKRTVYAAIV
jgi:hypothetical protein